MTESTGVGLDLSTIRAAPWVWAAGGELVDDPENPTKFLFDTPQGRRGLEHVIALQKNGWAPSADEADSQGVDERFMEGTVGMFLSSRRDVPVLRQITDFQWDVAPFPTDQEPASVLHSDGFCLSKHDNADAAWKWVEYALSADGQQVLAASGRSVPSIKAVAESPSFLEPTDPPANSKVFIDALSQMHQLPVTKNWSEVEGLTDDVLEELYYGRISLDKGLERARRGDSTANSERRRALGPLRRRRCAAELSWPSSRESSWRSSAPPGPGSRPCCGRSRGWRRFRAGRC